MSEHDDAADPEEEYYLKRQRPGPFLERRQRRPQFEPKFDAGPIFSARGVQFRFLSFDDFDKRISLCLQIDDDTTIEDVIQAWADVRRWREVLQKHNGPWVRGGKSALFFHMNLRHKRGGMSYAQLAQWMNEQIAGYLQRYARFLALMPFPEGMKWLERMRWLDELEKEHDADHLGEKHAYDLLAALRPGLTPAQCEEILIGGLTEIEAGRPPFIGRDNPIDKSDVFARIREWRQKWPEQQEFEIEQAGKDEG